MRKTKPLVKPQRRKITSSLLSRAKGVSQTLVRPDGEYSLVAVIETAAANQKLARVLHVVKVQRGKRLQLQSEVEKLPADAQQERSQLTGEIGKIEEALMKNLQFLQKDYGYNMKHDYSLVPIKSTLMRAGSQKGSAAQEVKQFGSVAEYQDFQQSMGAYKAQLNRALQEWGKDIAPNEEGKKVIPTAELQQLKKEDETLACLAAEIEAKYGINMDTRYTIQFQKSALYVKVQ